jgi:hypothetical protein
MSREQVPAAGWMRPAADMILENAMVTDKVAA